MDSIWKSIDIKKVDAMKNLFILLFFAFSLNAISETKEPVKLSKSGICHAPGSTYYEQTKNFTSYKTLDECLKAGGRLPKK
jgi:hypothetical protein